LRRYVRFRMIKQLGEADTPQVSIMSSFFFFVKIIKLKKMDLSLRLLILSLALLILLTFDICGAVNPGMKLTISAKGLFNSSLCVPAQRCVGVNKILQIGLPKILPQLQNLKIPDTDGKARNKNIIHFSRTCSTIIGNTTLRVSFLSP